MCIRDSLSSTNHNKLVCLAASTCCSAASCCCSATCCCISCWFCNDFTISCCDANCACKVSFCACNPWACADKDARSIPSFVPFIKEVWKSFSKSLYLSVAFSVSIICASSWALHESSCDCKDDISPSSEAILDNALSRCEVIVFICFCAS